MNTWSPNIYPPLGLAYVAASLLKSHDVKIIDLNVQTPGKKEWRQEIESSDAVGIGGMITEYQNIVDLAHFIRAVKPSAKIILGGALASTYINDLLLDTGADYTVLNEGETTTPELLDAIALKQDIKKINGVAINDGGVVKINTPRTAINDLDSIPYPARSLLNMESYIRDYLKVWGITQPGHKKLRGSTVITSRGCPYSCTFCSKAVWGNKWRSRSAVNIIGEIKSLRDQYGINEIIFNDDNFMLNKKRVMEFCRLLNQEKVDIIWYCNGRVNLVDKEVLQAMYNAGCRGIAYGLESGNQKVLDRMQKNITIKQIKDAVRLTKQAGIKITGYFILGMLDETQKDIEATLLLARQLDLDYYGFSTMTPIPQTELWNQAYQEGKVKQASKRISEWSSRINYNITDGVTDKELMDYERQTLKEFYLKKHFGRCYYLSPGFYTRSLAYSYNSIKSGNLKNLLSKVF